MSDYIKDLNIVDFLGIIVPGSILVLLLSGNNADLLLLWTSYFGADASPLVRGVFLAIAGYLAGMILHEIGDLAEKGAWCFPCLDPKAYAINAVGINDLDEATKAAELNEEVSSDQRCVFSPFTRGVLGCFLAFLLLASCTVGFSKAMSSAANMAIVPQASADVVQSTNSNDPQNANTTTPPTSADIQISVPTQSSTKDVNPVIPETPVPSENSIGKSTYVVSVVALAFLLITIFLISYRLYRKNDGTAADENSTSADIAEQYDPSITDEGAQPLLLNQPNKWKTLRRLCLQNPQIQTYVSQKGVPNKMSMFDSFRHVMRNLLIAVAIVNMFSVWHPIDLYRDIAAHFVNAGNISRDFGTLTFWFCFVILFAFSRYSHFVFLRYKYSYEAFVTQASQADKPDVPHHHIVLEHKNSSQVDT